MKATRQTENANKARYSQDDSENQDKTHGRVRKDLHTKVKKTKGTKFLSLTMVKKDTKITYRKKS